jgi:hypothetical protein
LWETLLDFLSVFALNIHINMRLSVKWSFTFAEVVPYRDVKQMSEAVAMIDKASASRPMNEKQSSSVMKPNLSKRTKTGSSASTNGVKSEESSVGQFNEQIENERLNSRVGQQCRIVCAIELPLAKDERI